MSEASAPAGDGAGRRGDGGPADRPGHLPRGLIALIVLFVLSAVTVLFAPIRWLGFPAALPGVDPAAPEYQRAIVDVVATQIDEGPIGDFPGVGVGDTGQDPEGDAAAIGEVPADAAERDDETAAPGSPADADAAPEPARDDAREAGEAAEDGTAAPDLAAVFVSWTLAEAGLPLGSPPSGRPGAEAPWSTPTLPALEDALRARGAFTDDPGYMPSVGDVILFDGPGPVGDDARIIVGVADRDITTAGFDGDKISITAMGLRGRSGVLGFGMTGELDRQRHEREASLAVGAGTAGAEAAADCAAATAEPRPADCPR